MTQWYLESLLADRLGLTRMALEDFRKSELKKNADWKIEDRQVVLRESAVKKMLARLDASDLDYHTAAQKNGAELELREFTVTRLFPNPHLIEARDNLTGEVVRVAVPRNVNFRPRMIVRARPGQFPKFYRLEGRTPRYPGRW